MQLLNPIEPKGKKMDKQTIIKALYRRATGYDFQEATEEFVYKDGAEDVPCSPPSAQAQREDVPRNAAPVRTKDKKGAKRGAPQPAAKTKVSKKHMPSDISAIKLLLDILDADADLAGMTDEELAKEKTRLIRELKEGEREG
jgi:hypothetical protein